MEHKDIKQEKTIQVSIRCSVYNHEPYLRQCLDGFVMQKTNFAFEAIVHDDASTDKSADIIREYAAKYPDIIKPIYETENQYSKHDGSKRRIMNNAICQTAKYIAFCEGDDYWTDPLKLQKQFDFLEANPEYGMVHTKTEVYHQASMRQVGYAGSTFNAETGDIIIRNTITTLTVMIRKCIMLEYINEIKPEVRGWKMGDYPLWIYCYIKSKIKFIDQITGVYRILPESASHSNDCDKIIEFKLSVIDIQKFYIDKYKGLKIWANNTLDVIKLRFYIDNRIIIATCKNKEIKNNQYLFLSKNKFYGLLYIAKLLELFNNNKFILSYLERLSHFLIKHHIIRHQIKNSIYINIK